MYAVYYDFYSDYSFILRPALFTLPVLISLTVIYFNKRNLSGKDGKTFWNFALVVSIIISVSFWSSVLIDHSYYSRVYENRTYSIIEGELREITTDPNSQESFSVGDVVFRDSPRQMTSAFRDYKKLLSEIKKDDSVKI